jgi:hypothetical protein
MVPEPAISASPWSAVRHCPRSKQRYLISRRLAGVERTDLADLQLLADCDVTQPSFPPPSGMIRSLRRQWDTPESPRFAFRAANLAIQATIDMPWSTVVENLGIWQSNVYVSTPDFSIALAWQTGYVVPQKPRRANRVKIRDAKLRVLVEPTRNGRPGQDSRTTEAETPVVRLFHCEALAARESLKRTASRAPLRCRDRIAGLSAQYVIGAS